MGHSTIRTTIRRRLGWLPVLLAVLIPLAMTRWAEGRADMAHPQPVLQTDDGIHLVASVFASGTGGSAMTSTNYRMLGVVGEAGLASNTTTLTSQNYQHQPGFLAGEVQPSSRVLLPLTSWNYVRMFAGPNEQEDNDNASQANGALISGQDYFGLPNDQNDYFSFYAFGPGAISIDLSQMTGDAVQLQLYAGTVSVGTLVTFDSSAPFHIDHIGSGANTYYVRIFVGGGTNSNPYTLRVTYP